ncbi:hypothetical protein [Candidatus Methanoperedens nitratireducens]|uniref:Uncharacterized protein n=1 Tax=Candidatus Methanoperedens nitratireducens TaxID=1392998 RepID=A0A284VTZ9_9EURY|nr:hypothetical protein [Candidatus Methanoperedens nitroreducens]SNQ62775.1 hypothetical protein MNV_870009 [Candidatus Methanoperedens nitroreducens]
MDLNEELLSLREKNRVLSEENKELDKHQELLSERIKKLEEEIQRLKEENQKLRLILFGFKPPKKEQSESLNNVSKPEPKKRGPPIGHKGTSRKKPDRVDRTFVHE